jgi:hypothetical protein
VSCKSAYPLFPYQHALESELLVVTRNEITLLALHIAQVVSLLPFATLLPLKNTFALS